MSDSFGLELGAQAQAARALLDRLPEIDRSLVTLGESIEAHAAGFRGASAAALAEALKAWFASAGQLSPALARYAYALLEVDRTVAAAEGRGTSRLGAAYGGGGSGLNMGAE